MGRIGHIHLLVQLVSLDQPLVGVVVVQLSLIQIPIARRSVMIGELRLLHYLVVGA